MSLLLAGATVMLGRPRALVGVALPPTRAARSRCAGPGRHRAGTTAPPPAPAQGAVLLERVCAEAMPPAGSCTSMAIIDYYEVDLQSRGGGPGWSSRPRLWPPRPRSVDTFAPAAATSSSAKAAGWRAPGGRVPARGPGRSARRRKKILVESLRLWPPRPRSVDTACWATSSSPAAGWRTPGWPGRRSILVPWLVSTLSATSRRPICLGLPDGDQQDATSRSSWAASGWGCWPPRRGPPTGRAGGPGSGRPTRRPAVR